MANYEARLDKLEQRTRPAAIRFVWMNPGETRLDAATRYVGERKLGVQPETFLAIAKDRAAGRICFIGWESNEVSE